MCEQLGIKVKFLKKMPELIHKESTELVFSPQLLAVSKADKRVENSDSAIKNWLATLGVGRARARC